MMRPSLHRIAPTLLALGLLPAAWSATSSERNAHMDAVRSLIEREYRLPAQRQLADFQQAAYSDAQWHGKYLSWFFADRFRTLALDKAEQAKLDAEARTLDAELKAALKAKQLPKEIADLLGGNAVVIRLVNDLLRVVGQDQAPDRLGAEAVVPEKRAALNATVSALIAATNDHYATCLAAVAAHAKAEEEASELEEKDPKFQKIGHEAVELRLAAIRPVYFAFKTLREVAERGQDFGLDPAPAQAFLSDFATKNFDVLENWGYQWGDYHAYLRAYTAELAGQAARFKVKNASADDLANEQRKILEIDVAKEFRDAATAEEVRTLQAKSWSNLLAWYREMGRDVAPKYYQAGLDAFQQFKEQTRGDRHFRLDHPNRERAAEVARIYFQAARIQAAKKDPMASATMNLVAAARSNPLAGNASLWSLVINGKDAKPVRGAGAWGAQPVAEDPAGSVLNANALLRQARASGDPATQRSALLAAAVSLRNGVLGLNGATYAETADDAAPELWFRYAETLSKLGMRWHAALISQAGLRHLAGRTSELKGKSPWKDKDGKWTASGRFVSPLAKNAVTYASNLLVAGKGSAITQLYDDAIALLNQVSPEDGGKTLDRIQIVIAIQGKDFTRALELSDAYAKKYPEEFYDAASLRSQVFIAWYDASKPAERKSIAERALKEAKDIAEKAKKELPTAADAARKRVLNQAILDVQALSAFLALREGKEEQVLTMLGTTYWKNAPSDNDKAAQMLSYLCQALRQSHMAQTKDPAKGTDAKLLVASWPRIQAVYSIWKTQKGRLTSHEDSVGRSGQQIAVVFQTIAAVQIPAMRSQPGAPPQLGEIATAASRAYADLIEPTITERSKPDLMLQVGNVLWDLDEHERACRLLELYLNRAAGDPELAALRDTPKQVLAALDTPIRARPELRAKWDEVVDLLYDDPELTKRIIEQDLPESEWREKKRDYVRAIEAIRALRTDLGKAKMSLGPAFQTLDDGLVKLDGQVAQLAREISVTAKLALGFREQGEKAKANALYEKLIAFDPTNPDFLAATVELTIEAIKDGKSQVTAEKIEQTRIKAARVRSAAPNGSPTYWTAVIQVLELSLAMKDLKLVNETLKFDAVNQSTPADDLQQRPRNPRDDKRVRRAANALAADLCKRYLAIFTQPGVTAKPSFAIREAAIDGRTVPIFVPPEAPPFAAVRRELDDGTVVFFLWEEGKEAPPEPEAAPAPPSEAPAPETTAPEAKP